MLASGQGGNSDRKDISDRVMLSLKAPEVTRRNTRLHFIQSLKERIVREVGYGLSLEGASAADLVKSMQAKSEPAARKGKSA
jgi:hypothetical protein